MVAERRRPLFSLYEACKSPPPPSSSPQTLRRDIMFFPRVEERRAEKLIPRPLRIPGLLRPKDREGELTRYPEYYAMLMHYNYWSYM